MKNRRHEERSFAEFEKLESGEFDYQSPEQFASTDDLACSEDEVRKICDEVRDHL